MLAIMSVRNMAFLPGWRRVAETRQADIGRVTALTEGETAAVARCRLD